LREEPDFAAWKMTCSSVSIYGRLGCIWQDIPVRQTLATLEICRQVGVCCNRHVSAEDCRFCSIRLKSVLVVSETDNAASDRQILPLRTNDGSRGQHFFQTSFTMHTDRKIGFAMGILLIGIVAALFFRNEPLLSTKVSGVRRERQLNQELRERDVAVYLNDGESEITADQTPDEKPWTLRDVLRSMDERNKTAPVPVGVRSFPDRSPPPIDDKNLDGYRPSRNRQKAEPIATGSKSAELAAESLGSLLESSVPATSSGKFGALPPLPVEPANPVVARSPISPGIEPASSKGAAADFQPPELFEEYVVKYGDTLSGIALRMLGAQSKYMEIYNANRDRVASPDRLDVGKPLRIPRVAAADRPTY